MHVHSLNISMKYPVQKLMAFPHIARRTTLQHYAVLSSSSSVACCLSVVMTVMTLSRALSVVVVVTTPTLTYNIGNAVHACRQNATDTLCVSGIHLATTYCAAEVGRRSWKVRGWADGGACNDHTSEQARTASTRCVRFQSTVLPRRQ